jgi:drug/metabolite transporter (DMT)-like permease
VSALVLGLGAGLGWGVSDFLGGLAGRRARLFAVLTVAQLTGLALMLVVLGLRTPPVPSSAALGWAALAGVSGAIGIVGLYRGLAVGSMSLIAPVSSLAVLVPVVVGLARGERPAPIVAVGLALAIAGSVLAGWAPGAASTRGLWLAVVAALGFGGGFVFIDQAAEEGALWAFTASRVASAVIITAVALALLGGVPRIGRPNALLAGAAGLTEATAGLAFAAATTVGLLSVVSVLSSLYPAVTIALAYVVLGERLGPVQRVAVALVLAGVGAIAYG